MSATFASPMPIIVLLATILVAVHLFVATVVYRGAEEHGMNAVGWAAFYLLTGPVGWIVYAIACQAGGLGGSSVMAGSNPARKRLVDQRRMVSGDGGAGIGLPKPSKGFSDGHLDDLIAGEDWSGGLAHAEEMRKMALEEGNKLLAGDYSRVIMRIESKLRG